jgi:hypothetical protein
MSSTTGRHERCECGSGKKYKDCCGAPHVEVRSMRASDIGVFELTPGLGDALTASLDASYMEYIAAGCSRKAQRKLEDGLQPYRRTSVISLGYLTRWIAHLQISILRPRGWTYLTCRAVDLKPSNGILSSAYGKSKC